MEAELALRLGYPDAGTGSDDRNQCVSSIGQYGAVFVRLVRAGVGRPIKQGGHGLLIRTCLTLVSVAMDKLPVLGAAAMLDEEHMAAARTLEHEREKGSQDTRTPNHSEFGEVSLRRGHR